LKRLLLFGLGLVIFIAALVVGWNFGAANATTLDIDLLWVTVAEITVWQLTLAAFGLGAGLVLLAAGFFGTRGWLLRRRYRATIRRLESELHQLRSLPLAEADEAAIGSERAPRRMAKGGA